MGLFVERGEFSSKLSEVPVGYGLPQANILADELESYADVLLGRVEPPNDDGYMTLLEYADVVYARACEMEMLIHEAERNHHVVKGSDHYRFRTGALRSFLSMAKSAAERGSRRLTNERLLYDMMRDSGEVR